jgi:3-phosphoglycerate kinase
MKSSDTIAEVMKKINAVTVEMGTLGKSADNPFFKSKYVPLEKVQEMLRPKLAEHKVGVSQPLYEHGIATIVTDLESGEWVMFPSHINNTGLKPQDQMSGVTYMKRYGLVGVFNLEVGDKDDDGNAINKATSVKEKTITPANINDDLDF